MAIERKLFFFVNFIIVFKFSTDVGCAPNRAYTGMAPTAHSWHGSVDTGQHKHAYV